MMVPRPMPHVPRPTPHPSTMLRVTLSPSKGHIPLVAFVTMRMLGIESSCDETSAAVVEETLGVPRPWQILSNVVASQVAIHREWGGVVPELASRQHIRDICGVVDRALADARADLADIGAVAVTQGPGLVGSLLVGVCFGKSLAYARGIPILAVDHLEAHIRAAYLESPEPIPH